MNWKLPFLDAEMSLKGTDFVTTVCRKLNVNGVFTHFDNFCHPNINLVLLMTD